MLKHYIRSCLRALYMSNKLLIINLDYYNLINITNIVLIITYRKRVSLSNVCLNLNKNNNIKKTTIMK